MADELLDKSKGAVSARTEDHLKCNGNGKLDLMKNHAIC